MPPTLLTSQAPWPAELAIRTPPPATWFHRPAERSKNQVPEPPPSESRPMIQEAQSLPTPTSLPAPGSVCQALPALDVPRGMEVATLAALSMTSDAKMAGP